MRPAAGQCSIGIGGGSTAIELITTVGPEISSTINGRFPSLRMRAPSRLAASIPRLPSIGVNPAMIVSRSPQPCTHKSVGLIDVRLHPNSGAQADTSELRMWARSGHEVNHLSDERSLSRRN